MTTIKDLSPERKTKECPNKGRSCFCDGTCKEPVEVAVHEYKGKLYSRRELEKENEELRRKAAILDELIELRGMATRGECTVNDIMNRLEELK